MQKLKQSKENKRRKAAIAGDTAAIFSENEPIQYAQEEKHKGVVYRNIWAEYPLNTLASRPACSPTGTLFLGRSPATPLHKYGTPLSTMIAVLEP